MRILVFQTLMSGVSDQVLDRAHRKAGVNVFEFVTKQTWQSISY